MAILKPENRISRGDAEARRNTNSGRVKSGPKLGGPLADYRFPVSGGSGEI